MVSQSSLPRLTSRSKSFYQQIKRNSSYRILFRVGFVIHWVAPFDFNLYDNSFAVFPLSPEHREKDCKQIYKEIKNSICSYSAEIKDKSNSCMGIRGIAKDGPKAFQHRNVWISARMGSTHSDCLQISFIPV